MRQRDHSLSLPEGEGRGEGDMEIPPHPAPSSSPQHESGRYVAGAASSSISCTVVRPCQRLGRTRPATWIGSPP